MVVCWRHAEARAFEPFEDEALPEGKEPNELRIGLFQATGLAVKDKALLFVMPCLFGAFDTIRSARALDAVDAHPDAGGAKVVRTRASRSKWPARLSGARPRQLRSLWIPRGSR